MEITECRIINFLFAFFTVFGRLRFYQKFRVFQTNSCFLFHILVSYTSHQIQQRSLYLLKVRAPFLIFSRNRNPQLPWGLFGLSRFI